MSPGPRVLCIDSSSHRLKEITEALQQADFEVWTAQGVSDAMCLAAGLHFDALAVDQASMQLHPDVWDCLAEAQPELPMLVHSEADRSHQRCGEGASQKKSSRVSEVVLALLLLLLGNPTLPQAHAA
jgi:DNA-binding NtrC family response regulator